MRKSLLTILVLIISVYAYAQSVPVIRATDKLVDIKDGEEWHRGSWTISPDLKPDVYATMTEGSKTVAFHTDIDSIAFEVAPGQSYDFVILLNETDSCYQRIKARKKAPPAQFSEAFIRDNRNQYTLEVPEVQELVHIIIALTPTGIADSNMVNHQGEYYQRVLDHFKQYSDEPVVKQIDQIVKVGNYARLKMDACGYHFGDDNAIRKDETYDRLNWGEDNYIESYVEDLESFAIKSDFQEFYRANEDYYNKLIALMRSQTPIKKMWVWLEERFPDQYDHYRITFSPLVEGSHSTNRFEDGDFKQTVMFISGPIENSTYNKEVVEGFMSRVVFTEIDHNYVNPVSDQHIERIDEVFADRSTWVEEGDFTGGYASAYSVFNEYMTWAVFSLYALDTFGEEDFSVINERVEQQMSEWRGFSNFKSFNQKMIALYQNQPITDLYPAILNWCEEQSASANKQ